MMLPSSLMSGSTEVSLPPALPELLTLTSVVVPATRSRRKMSPRELVGVLTRSLARLWKATKRPSALITGESEKALPAAVPAALTLTKVVTPVTKLRTYTSVVPLLSLTPVRLLAPLANTSRVPSALRTRGLVSFVAEKPFPAASPTLLTPTRTGVLNDNRVRSSGHSSEGRKVSSRRDGLRRDGFRPVHRVLPRSLFSQL